MAKIYCVGGAPDFVAAVRRPLEGGDHEVIGQPDGISAICFLQDRAASEIDVVLTDGALDGRSGVEVVVLAWQAGIRKIALFTAHTGEVLENIQIGLLAVGDSSVRAYNKGEVSQGDPSVAQIVQELLQDAGE